ncbi:MAG: beta-propeller fold lactonase family protein [Gemmatimonadaceae bacterium]
MNRFLALSAAVLLGACSAQDATVPGASVPDPSFSRDANPTGTVWVQTNDGTKNQIVAFRRAANGKLSLLRTFDTGGRGTGTPRLGSQGSVILSADEEYLYVTNGGSNEISVFAVTRPGGSLIQTISSGGTAPYSITRHGNLVYVLNEGGFTSGPAANITGFTIGQDGTLTALAGSTRPLSTAYAQPAQVSFNPEGTALVVTEKATDKIDTYAVGANGLASAAPIVNVSNGQTPFGFAFRNDGVFVVTEAHGAAAGLASASSYSLDGGFHSLSTPPSVRDFETDVCWAVIAGGGRYAYITNFGSGTLSSYTIASNGALTLLKQVAARTAAAQGPRDLDLDRSGEYLYVLDVGFADASSRAVNGFIVGSDGTLTKIGSWPLPGNYPNVAGLAAQ